MYTTKTQNLFPRFYKKSDCLSYSALKKLKIFNKLIVKGFNRISQELCESRFLQFLLYVERNGCIDNLRALLLFYVYPIVYLGETDEKK